MMKSSQKVGGAAAARWFSAAAPALFPRHPLSTLASTVSRRAAKGTALAPAVHDTANSRLWFYVAPDAGDSAWAVMFEGQSQPFGYESQEHALTAACLAAEVMHRRHRTAAGVRLRAGTGWLDAVKLGVLPGDGGARRAPP